MRYRSRVIAFAFSLLPALLVAATSSSPEVRVARFAVFEQTFHWTGADDSNPWEQVSLEMTVTSPSRRQTRIRGFYVDDKTWAARFAPSELGLWRWTATVSDNTRRENVRGAFRVTKGGHGFVRTNPRNRFRWTFSDGTPYYPLGIGDCVRDNDRSGSPFDDFYVDTRKTTVQNYLRTHQEAGVNLFRWSVDNCAFGLYRHISPGGNAYLVREGKWGDTFVRELRAHGFRIYMTIFGFHPPFADAPSTAEIAAIKHYVDYVVARYGAYVDFWELMNEARASNGWYDEVARYLRSVDVYHHPIATSWERPDLSVIDVNSPHWYEKEEESASDVKTWTQISTWKSTGKPVVVGEQGNSGQNWDERSALRMRLRAWTAFFAEGALVFWNTSTTKSYRSSAANLYLGPEERSYLRVLQRFTRGFDPRARITGVDVRGSGGLRGYALSGPRAYAAYLHASQNHTSPTRDAVIRLRLPAGGAATWVDPASGRTISHLRIARGTRTLAVPAFVTDVALKIGFRR